MYFDENALMRTGRITLGDDSYYLEDDGTVLPGWHEEEVYDEENDETVTETFYVCRDGYILDTDKETGSAGRLVIHDCGIDVRVFKPSSRDDYQKITDEENSALIVRSGATTSPPSRTGAARASIWRRLGRERATPISWTAAERYRNTSAAVCSSASTTARMSWMSSRSRSGDRTKAGSARIPVRERAIRKR